MSGVSPKRLVIINIERSPASPTQRLKTAFLGQGGFDSQVRLLTLLTSNGSESVSVHLRFTCLLSLKSLAE